MDYYTRRVKAQSAIEQIIRSEKEVSISQLFLTVQRNFGLSEKFVKLTVKLLEQNKICSVRGGRVIAK